MKSALLPPELASSPDLLGDLAREALRISESRYRRLFETAQDGILMLNAETGQIEDVNPYLIEMLGYSHAEFLGKKLWEVGTFANVPQSKKMFLKLQTKGYVRYDDLPLKTKAGERVQVEFVSNSYDCEGIKVIQCNIRNITKRKFAETAVLQEKNFTHAALDSLPGLFYVIDDQSRFLRWNKNFELISGYSSEEISRLSPTDLFTGPDKGIIAERIRQVFFAGDATAEADFVAKDQTKTPYFFTGKRVQIDQKFCLIGMGIDIAERKRAEHEMQRFRLAMDISGDAILLVDRASMRYIDVNQTLCDLIGYTRQELLGMTPMDVFSASRETLERDYDAIIADRNSSAGRAEGQYRHKDGSLIPIETRRRALHTDNGWIIVGTARDISVRQRMEETLRESEERFSSAFAHAPIGIALVLPDGRWLKVNKALCDLVGYSEAELLTRTFQDITYPEDLEIDLENVRRMIAGEIHSYEMEKRYVHARGHLVTVLLNVSLVRDVQGQPLYFISQIQDITERNLAEQSLRRFRLAMDALAESIYLTDPVAMRFVDVNSEACRRLGYSREQLLKMGPQDVLGPDVAQIKREYEQVMAAGDQGLKTESTFVTTDGRRGWTELHRRAFRVKGDSLIVSIGRDVTERKQADEKIRRLNRVYAVLSGIKSAIVRVLGRSELFEEACRIAISEGGFVVARVISLDENGKAHIAATTEKEPSAFLQVLDEFNRNAGKSYSLLAQALHTGQPVISNDMYNDLRVENRAALAKGGTYALALLPLTVEKRVIGCFVLRAKDAGMFDDEELRLLLEMVSDMSFALDHIAKGERLNYLAMYDQLTGLANRTLFLERLNQFIQVASPTGNKVAVVLADVERLRTINESLGRQAGDVVIKGFAERLAVEAGKGEVARIGTDHFAVVMHIQAIKGKSETARRIDNLWQSCLAEPFSVAGTELRLAAKAGVTLFPNDGADAELLLRNAEAALVKAKQLGERYVFYTSSLTARTGERLTLENQLRQALEKDEFVLHYQPKVDTETRRIVGVEALIRWQSPELGLVPPMKFIPLMEETGLILDVGAWALDKAVADHSKWAELGFSALRVAVNVSAIQLRRRDFVFIVEDALTRGTTPPGIDLEITESLVMEDIESNMQKLKDIRGLGLGIAIDDFGTGYSSLGYLAKLPVQTLKIDRSFVITMLKDPATMTLVQTIISLAHSLRLNVIAEGVDEEEQAKVLRLLRCDEMQGYLFSKPLPFERMTEMLKSRTGITPAA